MQNYTTYNTKKKASILIWAIFLSVVISVTFAMISSKITKNLNNNSNRIDKINTFNNLDLFSKKNIILDNGDNLYFEKENSINRTIKKDEIYDIKTVVTQDSSLQINIDKGSELYYKIISYSGSLGINTGTKIAQGLIQNNETINFTYDSNKDYRNIQLYNLGGYSNITLTGSLILEAKDTKFSIINKIGNKYFIKSSGLLNN